MEDKRNIDTQPATVRERADKYKKMELDETAANLAAMFETINSEEQK